MLHKSLRYDRKIWVENVAAKVAHILETNNTHEAYQYFWIVGRNLKEKTSKPNR
jgi:hypothetical protein